MSSLLERLQVPTFCTYEGLWSSSKRACGCLCSLVNAILRGGTSTGLVSNLLMCCLLLYSERLIAVHGSIPFSGKHEPLEEGFCLSSEGSRGRGGVCLRAWGVCLRPCAEAVLPSCPFHLCSEITSNLWKTCVWVLLGCLFSVWAVSHLWWCVCTVLLSTWGHVAATFSEIRWSCRQL